MPNSASKARGWTEFIARRPEFPYGDRLLEAFNAGTITRLCECGCNSFDLEVDPSAARPIARATENAGALFTLSFRTHEPEGSIDFIIFADRQGQFAGMEVDFCANSYPVPDSLNLEDVPYQVHAESALEV